MDVLIADDSALLRSRLVALISELEGVSLVGQASTTSETIEAIQLLKPDVVILDIRMPGGGGFQVLEAIKTIEMAPTVIILTAFSDSLYRRKSLELGAAHFFDKTTEFDQVVEVLRQLPGHCTSTITGEPS